MIRALCVALVVLAGCSSDKPTVDEPVGTSAVGWSEGKEVPPSPGNVDTLLQGGSALTSLPVRATDSAQPFDPNLRQRLAPGN
jgi:hypothetical protein